MLEITLSILSLALIYAATSALLLRRRFTEQFQRIEFEFAAIRLLAFVIWWICAWLIPQLWHPVWWLSTLTLVLLAYAELAFMGVYHGGENQQTGSSLCVLHFFLLTALSFSFGGVLQPSIAWDTPSNVLWTVAYVILLFAALQSLITLFTSFLAVLARLLTFQPEVVRPIRTRLMIMLYVLIFAGTAALVFTANLDLRLWQIPIAMFLVSMGWGITIYLLANTPTKHVGFYLFTGIQTLSAVMVLYFLFREHMLPNLPPTTIPAPSEAAIVIGLLGWGTNMFIESVSASHLSVQFPTAEDLTARIASLQSQINKVENDERKSHLAVQHLTVREVFNSRNEEILGLQSAEITWPEVIGQVESLERSVTLEIQRQNAEFAISKTKDNLRLLETLRVFTQAHDLELPDTLPSPSELEQRLAQYQSFIREGNLEPILTQAEVVENMHVRLESLVNSKDSIELSEDLVKQPTAEVDKLQTLARSADYFELGHPEINGVVGAFQIAYQAYTNSETSVFEARADLSSRVNAAWKELEQSRVSIREQIQRESYEWQSQEPNGVVVYIPKALKQNETRRIIVIVTDEYSKPELSIEFECGLVSAGNKPSSSIKVPASGQQVLPYPFWSEATGKGYIQVVLDEAPSGPFTIRVLPTTVQVIKDVTQLILILGPIITVILVAAQIPVGTAAIYSGAASSVITVGFLVMRYLSYGQSGGIFRRK